MIKTAYLIIHGFGGGPEETAFLETYLKTKELDTYSVLIYGHGGSKKDLKSSNCADWIASVESFISSLRQKYARIVLLGFSMGGLLSIYVANTPQIDKIVLVNTPIFFWNMKIILKDIAITIKNPRSEKLNYYMESITKTSLKSGIDFLHLLHKTKKKIEKVKKPTLIIQCKGDESVHYKSGRYIKNKMGDDATLRYYDGGCHQVFIKSPEVRETVCDCIYDFIRSEHSIT